MKLRRNDPNLFTNDNKSTIYKINKDETFELFGEIEIKGEATPYFERIVPLKENILLK